MSIESWEAEFYPISAVEVAQPGTPELELIRHSLRKWRGLQPDTLLEHEARRVVSSSSVTSGDGTFRVGGDTCALCERHYDAVAISCATCPLAIVRGGVPCDDEMRGEMDPPWESWTKSSDPNPMILWLTKAEAACCPG